MTLITKSEELMAVSVRQGVELAAIEAKVLLGYLEGHDYSLMMDDKFHLALHDNQDGEDADNDQPYTIRDCIDFCQEMNSELLLEEAGKEGGDPDYFSELQKDELILDRMMETIHTPRPELSPFAPRILQFSINPDKIREVIGSGGKTINGIIAETGVKIDIEDDGRVFIASTDAAAAEKAKNIIDNIVRDIQVGDVILGKVVNILPIGAQVELKPGKKGLVHISKLSNKRVERVEDVVSIGDEILVRVIEIKPDGKIDLTRKGLIPEEGRR